MNKRVLITGATSGIGLATAKLFAQHQYDLILTGRREERLHELRQSLVHTGIDVMTLGFDIRNREDVEQVMEKVTQPIDILVNNAGLARGFDYIHEGNIEHWEEMIDTNVKGLLYITRIVSQRMVERQSGHIINVCSTAGKEVYPRGNVYCATKFAVDALTRSIRAELFTHGIRVSQVAPAHVEETEFARVRYDWDMARASIYNDFNPLTSPDVAEAIYFIASQPPHVNILDITLQGTQQAGNMMIDRTGRKYDNPSS